MRYDDYDDSRRSSRSGSGRREPGRRSEQTLDYDYYNRTYGGNRRRRTEFDREGWRNTAPDWNDRSGSRRRESDRRGYDEYDDYDRDYRGRDRGRDDYRRERDDYDRDRRGRRSSGDSGRKRKGSSRKKSRTGVSIPLLVGVIVVAVILLLVKFVFLSGGSSSSYQMSLSTQSIVVGDTATASLSGIPTDQAANITWSTSNAEFVTVDGNGLTATLTAKSEGQATIAANINDDISVSGTVIVVKTAVGVMNITMSTESATVSSGETYELHANVTMEEGLAPATVKWSSNDTNVARVSDDGVVSARDVGMAIIKATAGEKTAECVVTVVENPNGTPHDGTLTTGQTAEDGSVPTEATDPNDSNVVTEGNVVDETQLPAEITGVTRR